MRRSMRSRYKWIVRFGLGETGSALVETALTMPILIMLLGGAVEFGDYAFKSTQVANAARSAAQYAAMNGGGYADCNNSINGGTCSATSGVAQAAKKDAPWVASKCSSFTVTIATSCICSDTTACTTANFACSTGKPEITVTAQTQAQCSAVASVPGLSLNSLTFHGYSQQMVLP
jgi:hypothetical protein